MHVNLETYQPIEPVLVKPSAQRRPAWCVVVLGLALLAGCGVRLGDEARLVDNGMARLRADSAAQRRAATANLFARSPESVRHLVIPRLAVESAGEPLLIVTHDSSIHVGAVVGGNAQSLSVNLRRGALTGATLRLDLASIEAIRLPSPASP